MDPKLAFWTFALLEMGVVVAFAAAGVRAVRRGDVERHRRRMLTAAALVLVFVLSYAGKLAVLGREDRSGWGATSIWILRVHELCVFTMLAAGGVALARALRLRRTRDVTTDPGDPPAPVELVRRHRRAGRTAVVAAVLGFALAMLVLAGMYRRAGMP
jgi:putative membrane protein